MGKRLKFGLILSPLEKTFARYAQSKSVILETLPKMSIIFITIITIDRLITSEIECVTTNNNVYRFLFFQSSTFLLYYFRDVSCEKALRFSRVGSGRASLLINHILKLHKTLFLCFYISKQ